MGFKLALECIRSSNHFSNKYSYSYFHGIFCCGYLKSIGKSFRPCNNKNKKKEIRIKGELHSSK